MLHVKIKLSTTVSSSRSSVCKQPFYLAVFKNNKPPFSCTSSIREVSSTSGLRILEKLHEDVTSTLKVCFHSCFKRQTRLSSFSLTTLSAGAIITPLTNTCVSSTCDATKTKQSTKQTHHGESTLTTLKSSLKCAICAIRNVLNKVTDYS